MSESDRGKDTYEGLSPVQLKSAFWELYHKLPPRVSDKDITDAQTDLGKRIAGLVTGQPVEESGNTTLNNRAHSQLRRAYSARLLLLLSRAPITPTYASFIVNRRFRSAYHWGVDSSQSQDPNAFPAYLTGLEDDNENIGIFDAAKTKEIERSDYREVVKDHLYEHEQIVAAFGQAAIDDLQRRIREGLHPEHSRTILLNNWRRDFMHRYQEEP